MPTSSGCTCSSQSGSSSPTSRWPIWCSGCANRPASSMQLATPGLLRPRRSSIAISLPQAHQNSGRPVSSRPSALARHSSWPARFSMESSLASRLFRFGAGHLAPTKMRLRRRWHSSLVTPRSMPRFSQTRSRSTTCVPPMICSKWLPTVSTQISTRQPVPSAAHLEQTMA